MTQAYLSIGSNQGDSREILRQAAVHLHDTPGIRVELASSLYETDPVGKTDQPVFLNAVLLIQTTLEPLALLDACQSVEQRLGRVRSERWGPRTLDIDLLTYGDVILDSPRLTLPHPRMAERAFVQVPLRELADNHIDWTDAVRPAAFRWCDFVSAAPRWLFKTRTGSTNEDMRRLAHMGLPAGSVLVSDTQTAGRGRMGRVWESKPGAGVWMSILLRPNSPTLPQIGWVPLATGLAVSEVLRGLGADVGLKWPNDVLCNGRKICGILCESVLSGSSVDFIIIGIGLNLFQTPDMFDGALADTAISLRQVIPRSAMEKVSRNGMAALILSETMKTVKMIITDRQTVLNAYRARSCLTGRVVYATRKKIGIPADPPDSLVIRGVVRGITDGGALEIQTEHGLMELESGEVTLQPTGGMKHDT